VILTIDAGTGGGRAILFDIAGRILARAHETWRYDVGEPGDLPFIRPSSFDPEAFWQALCRCVRRVLAEGGVGCDEIGAVVATSQREGCVFLDGGGHEVYAGPNADARGALEALEAQQIVGGDRLHQITGHAPPFIFPMARFLWFRKHRPSVTVRHILMISDWILYRLTGEVGMEPSNASESMLFDVRERWWSEEILAKLDIPAAVLPPLRAPGERIGAVTDAAATATGLRAGTPVIVGGADTQVALLGSGALEPGETATIIGSTAPVQTVVSEPIIDPAGSLWTGCHVVPDRWVCESNGGEAGSAYAWLLELLGATAAADPYDTAESWVRPRDATQRSPLMLVGPAIFNLTTMNPYRPAGLLFPYPLLEVGRPDRGALVRALLENIAFAIRGNCEQIVQVVGRPTQGLRVSGGMSRGKLLIRMLADVMNGPIQVGTVAESAALGCAILGAVGLGAYSDAATAAAAMVRTTIVEPQGTGTYDEQYAKWREVYAAFDAMTI